MEAEEINDPTLGATAALGAEEEKAQSWLGKVGTRGQKGLRFTRTGHEERLQKSGDHPGAWSKAPGGRWKAPGKMGKVRCAGGRRALGGESQHQAGEWRNTVQD